MFIFNPLFFSILLAFGLPSKFILKTLLLILELEMTRRVMNFRLVLQI